jgi:hypothetical protein
MCAAVLTANSVAVDRNWTKFPALVEIDTKADVYAIGDIHSDYARLTLALRGAGLIDSIPSGNVRWRAHQSVLVVTGDMIDKGPRALDVLRLLSELQTSANAEGGRVVVLAGFHEAEFLADPLALKRSEFTAQLAAKELTSADVAACKGEIGHFCVDSLSLHVSTIGFSRMQAIVAAETFAK